MAKSHVPKAIVVVEYVKYVTYVSRWGALLDGGFWFHVQCLAEPSGITSEFGGRSADQAVASVDHRGETPDRVDTGMVRDQSS
jgi:hypothetical protein